MPSLLPIRAQLIISKTATDFVPVDDFIDFTYATEVCDPEPSAFQISTENYKKAHVRICGLPITIETPQGVIRKKRNPDGSLIWAREMPFAYGYINNTLDADLDPVDVFVGDCPTSRIVYIMDQQHHKHKTFDEHKTFIWFPNKKAAKHCYYDSFENRKDAKKRVMAVAGMHIVDFKTWLKTNGTMHPIGKQDLPDLV